MANVTYEKELTAQQEITTRLPGRGFSMDTATLTELLRETAEITVNTKKLTPSTIGGIGMLRT